MNKNLLFLAALCAMAFSACSTAPKVADNHKGACMGTVVSSIWQPGFPPPNYASVTVKFAPGSMQPATKWSLDNSPVRYNVGQVVNAVTPTAHTARFYPPAGCTGPAPYPFVGKPGQRLTILIKYQ